MLGTSPRSLLSQKQAHHSIELKGRHGAIPQRFPVRTRCCLRGIVRLARSLIAATTLRSGTRKVSRGALRRRHRSTHAPRPSTGLTQKPERCFPRCHSPRRQFIHLDSNSSSSKAFSSAVSSRQSRLARRPADVGEQILQGYQMTTGRRVDHHRRMVSRAVHFPDAQSASRQPRPGLGGAQVHVQSLPLEPMHRPAHTSGRTHGRRYSGRVRSALASASPMNVSVAGSSWRVRPTRAAMLPAWQSSDAR